jgi:uncharacterized membrane protein
MVSPRARWVETGREMERTYFFSDAVFAIAITLLALDIKIPKPHSQAIGTELPSVVLAQWQDMLSFFISFLIIGAYWMAHHRMFHYIKSYDARLLWLNLVFLMSIAFLPFPDKVLSEWGDREQFAVVFYAGSMAVAGLLLCSVWWYATKGHRLVDPNMDPRLVSFFFSRGLTPPLIFLVSIGISFVSLRAALCSWFLMLVIRPMLSRLHFPADPSTPWWRRILEG